MSGDAEIGAARSSRGSLNIRPALISQIDSSSVAPLAVPAHIFNPPHTFPLIGER
jgi:hypothetical protein